MRFPNFIYNKANNELFYSFTSLNTTYNYQIENKNIADKEI